ncbi:MAG: class C sortase [Actinomycetia bacterium]|nr:class C sortase [Actinomycetes bacterium]
MTLIEQRPVRTGSHRPDTAAVGADRARRRRRRQWIDRAIYTLALIASGVASIWPVAATYNNDWQAWLHAQDAVRSQETVPAADAAQFLADARAYNAALPPGLFSDPIGAQPLDNPAYAAYEQLLGGSAGIMGTLRIPDIGVNLPIRHGTSDEVLGKGAGHVYGTSLPVGGVDTHAALSAHRGLPRLTAFDNLPDLQVGDHFFIETYGEKLAYQVSEITTVLPHEMDHLARVEGADLVTLITCTPYGINSHRVLVTGERVPWTEEVAAKDASSFDWSIRDWMWPRIGAASLAVLILLFLVGRWITQDARRVGTRRGRRSPLRDGGVR